MVVAEDTLKNPTEPSTATVVEAELVHKGVERSVPPGGRQFVSIESQFTGPIPPPQVLAEYGEIRPDLVDRIVAMAEKQSAHRQSIEQVLVLAEARNSRLGIWCGLTIGLGGLLCAVLIAWMGHPWAGTVVGSLDITALVGVFVYGSRSKVEESTERDPGPDSPP